MPNQEKKVIQVSNTNLLLLCCLGDESLRNKITTISPFPEESMGV